MQEETNSIIQSIIIISSLFTLVAVFVIGYVIYFNKRKTRLINENIVMKKKFQEQLLQSRVEVQEHTFQSIGKELHDNVGQLLITSRMLLGLTERNLASPPDTLLTANATLEQAIVELRSLSKSLDKEWLEQFCFVDNIKTEIERVNTGKMIHAAFTFPDTMPLSSDEQIILFRIVQEAMQNAIKHANPKNIHIKAEEKDHAFCINICDDGCGITNQHKGQGISNMYYRTALLGGNINWESVKDLGTIVTISLPINSNRQ